MRKLLERLVPLVPRPRINLVLYHGVLAPNGTDGLTRCLTSSAESPAREHVLGEQTGGEKALSRGGFPGVYRRVYRGAAAP